MSTPPSHPLLGFARDLQRARSYRELFECTLAEIRASLGYQTIWLALLDAEDASCVRIVDALGAQRDLIFENFLSIPLAGDKMLEEVLEGGRVVVVDDARTDPRTNKAVVEQLQNRTIVNVPLAIVDKPFGALGLGTFGEEGCRPPSPEGIAHLIGLASFVSVAVSRLRLEERARQEDRQRRELEHRLARAQRLDTVGVLAGGVAHDFNNLLTVLMAATNLARGAKTPGEIQRELDAIEDVVERGAALTHQLLAMGRTQVLQLTDLELGPLLENFVTLLRRVIPASINIELLGAHRGLIVEADKTQLEQVVMNLCLNARDAMPDGGRLTIETEIVLINGTYIETHPWAKPGRYVLLTVTDTGCGIAKEHLDRIFDPFFTTKGEHTGTGLGLSVTHGIVQQHGGMLHCYSEVGIGTTFKIYLPLLARCARLVGSKIEARVQGGQERILVGDDDAAVRNVVSRILERAGYRVAMVTNGDEVCRAIESEPFDLVLLDVVMPGPSCTETIRRLRLLRADVRILLASGYTADTNVTTLLRDQNIPLLPKPYDPDRLMRAVRAELDRS